MFAQFFIRRPIFATVISLVIIIAGLVAANVLPISQYPEISPPTVSISANYPGASAETVARTVAAPIEQQLNGVEGLLYYTTNTSSTGQLSISGTFELGVNADQAAVNVNNKVNAVLPKLPEDVRRSGVVVQKRNTDILMLVSFSSPDQSRDQLYMANYASVNIVDEIKRTPGVGDVMVFGQDYAIRVWLQPDKMAQLGVTTTDVAASIAAQNFQYAAGKVGDNPAPAGQQLIYTVTARGRLIDPEQFGNIIVKAGGTSGFLRIRDIARVELGGKDYTVDSRLNGAPAVGLAVFLQSGANALATAQRVKAVMDNFSKTLPKGMVYGIPYDTTEFVQESIKEVVTTLLEAAVLVILVVSIFLQNWRATLIPILAVPVSLIGAFAGLWLFGFSINTLTLFAMVLAIGIVVDDAIIVLENVERLMSEDGLSPREAAKEAMREVSGAVVAIVLVLCAVFVPVAFLGGIAGMLYKQFAVTVSVSVVFSGIVALTLTPALCAILLKPTHGKPNAFFRAFNTGFAKSTHGYLYMVGKILHHRIIGALMFLVVVALAVFMFIRIPTSFVPSEDQGYVFGAVMLNDGATLDRTMKTSSAIQQQLNKHPAIDSVFMINGYDMIGGGMRSSSATTFIKLKPWTERTQSADEMVNVVIGTGMMQPDGMAIAFNLPAIRGLGTAGGFEAYIQSRGNDDPKELQAVVTNLLDELRKNPKLTGLNTMFRATTPQLHVEVDEAKAMSLNVSIADVFNSLQSTMGAYYVNDFNKFGRTYQVQVSADAQYRAKPEDLGRVYVRSADGNMIPLSALITVTRTTGAESLDRYNGFLAAKIMGNGVPGVSSGDVITMVEQTAAATLPEGYQLAWTGQVFQEKRTGSTSSAAFIFGMIMVFLILAAQYERWSLPIAVVMAIPFALLGALVAIWLRNDPNDIYFQIGMVVLIGLAAKNAILIVEFAAQQMAAGKNLLDAAMEAARLRFRPIVMTSLAFVLSMVPLVWATGAGAASRRSMGTGVFGGMLAATFVATIFIPLFFTWMAGLRKKPHVDDESANPHDSASTGEKQ